MDAILADFGKRTRQEDPVVHFYETFLAAYDPKLRETRGVYFTPEPVVSYIVRSVDGLLQDTLQLPEGLADASKVTDPQPRARAAGKGRAKPRKTDQSPPRPDPRPGHRHGHLSLRGRRPHPRAL